MSSPGRPSARSRCVQLPSQYQAVVHLGGGCGLRQGELFGLPVDEVGFDTGWLHISCQVKVAGGKLVFVPPNRNKERDVPLPDWMAHVLKQHIEAHPSIEVTWPWLRPHSEPKTKRLLFARPDGDGAVRRTDFNPRCWKAALVAAGVIPEPKRGERHQVAREHGMHALRHFYASVLVDAGQNIEALSTHLGHTDPEFTLRVFTHLLPSGEGQTRSTVDSLYRGHRFRAGRPTDGPRRVRRARGP
ncbi:site-specific integrase [Streptomyces sp. NPDC001691]|uniref:site-specific integrase n=1 Tax=Streptomyces sp. NPDC001691 TaxID=3364600 RepID=UPI0036A302AD